MKIEERNCKSDPLEGEVKLWDPNHSLGKNKICVQTRQACPMLMS
jgi:hypothetical protein